MPQQKIIKKYPNRRLYDMDLSLYITLEDLKRYIMEQVPFKIIDAKTEQDVTCQSLIQIIIELEGSAAAPIFTQEMLENIVRFYGNPLQALFQSYLKNTLDLFLNQKSHMHESMQESMRESMQESMKMAQSQDPNIFNSFVKAPEIANKNLEYWTEWWLNLQQKK